MKIRTTHNSIRYRLRKSELEALKSTRQVIESISFPNGVELRSALLVSDGVDNCQVSFDDGTISITLSTGLASQWINTNQVSIEHAIALADGDQLHILIEKDFPCLDRPNEDKSDTFWELADKPADSC